MLQKFRLIIINIAAFPTSCLLFQVFSDQGDSTMRYLASSYQNEEREQILQPNSIEDQPFSFAPFVDSRYYCNVKEFLSLRK